MARNRLRDILSKLSLHLDQPNSGLGSQNLLFMATELLLLKREDYLGLKLALIEEIEAHLHPQAQLRVIDYLQRAGGQFILTTHSPNLASKVHLRNLILVHGNSAYPMGAEFTKLRRGDYDFLERFLDVTKANLFFAKGVILVEGDSENLLIPALAEILDRPLHRYGVSIVNVGSTAFLRYSRVFLRANHDEPVLNIPVAVITDLDVREPDKEQTQEEKRNLKERRKNRRDHKIACYEDGDAPVKAFVSPCWTLEFELGRSKLRRLAYKALLEAKAIKNSADEHVTCKKANEISAQVDIEMKKNDHGVALGKYICKELADKNLSKPVMAQRLAQHIVKSDPAKVRKCLRKSEALRYLVEAIEHVTEKLSDDSSDS